MYALASEVHGLLDTANGTIGGVAFQLNLVFAKVPTILGSMPAPAIPVPIYYTALGSEISQINDSEVAAEMLRLQDLKDAEDHFDENNPDEFMDLLKKSLVSPPMIVDSPVGKF